MVGIALVGQGQPGTCVNQNQGWCPNLFEKSS
jgi:hypothetical protein